MKTICSTYFENRSSHIGKRSWTVHLWKSMRIVLLSLGMVLLVPFTYSVANDIEHPREEEQLTLIPKLNETRLEKALVFPLRVSVVKTDTSPEACLSFASVSFPYLYKGGEKTIPIGIKLVRMETALPKVPDQGIPTGQVVFRDPATGSLIALQIGEVTKSGYRSFLRSLPNDKRKMFEQGFSRQQESMEFKLINPWDSKRCLQIRLVHTGFIKGH